MLTEQIPTVHIRFVIKNTYPRTRIISHKNSIDIARDILESTWPTLEENQSGGLGNLANVINEIDQALGKIQIVDPADTFSIVEFTSTNDGKIGSLGIVDGSLPFGGFVAPDIGTLDEGNFSMGVDCPHTLYERVTFSEEGIDHRATVSELLEAAPVVNTLPASAPTAALVALVV